VSFKEIIMRKAHFTEHQIILVLNSVEADWTVKNVCREAGISYLFRTLNEAREIIKRWRAEYNSERPHESLNNLTPEEYRLMAENSEISKSAWN